MRGIFLLALLAMLFTVTDVWAGIGKKDTVMIFSPGPGLGDSFDNGGVNGGMDAFVHEQYLSTNYGNQEYILTSPISNCNNTHAASYLRFDLNGLPKDVDSVFVGFTHLDHTSYCYSNCNADFYFYRVTQRWYENTVNYQNQPPVDTAFYGPINISFPNSLGNKEYDITTTYRLWRDSVVPNFGLAVKSPTIGCNNASVIFHAYSSDDTSVSRRPYLKIYYKVDTGTVDTPKHINRFKTSNTVMLYPNPVTSVLNVDLDIKTVGESWYIITDIAGRKVLQEQIQPQQGNTKLAIPIHSLERGVYFFSIYTPDGKLNSKFIKQ